MFKLAGDFLADRSRRRSLDFLPRTRAAFRFVGQGRCAYCRRRLPSPGVICARCRNRLAYRRWKYCVRCGGEAAGNDADDRDCRWCRGRRFAFDRVRALGPYKYALRRVILRLKRHPRPRLTEALVDLLLDMRGDDLRWFRSRVVVPVPTYRPRRMRRCGMLADHLAETIGRKLGLPVAWEALIRIRPTRVQGGLPPEERFANVAGAFEVIDRQSIVGRAVLLVDDILTTGATCHEAARVLCDAGATRVDVAVLARAEGD